MLENLPKHLAIIMDGNGRWAKKRFLPRVAGHKAAVDVVRNTIKTCAQKKIHVLTLFAFSTENWRRPADEVSILMQLFIHALQTEVKKLHENNIQLRIIGNVSTLNAELQQAITEAAALTKNNTGMKLVVAVDYGGQWDILEATKKIGQQIKQNQIDAENITADYFQQHLSTTDLPPVDLLIRTSGEQRISNFLLWQLAYAEFYFAQTLWPDFNDAVLEDAFKFYQTRERRFGGIKANA